MGEREPREGDHPQAEVVYQNNNFAVHEDEEVQSDEEKSANAEEAKDESADEE